MAADKGLRENQHCTFCRVHWLLLVSIIFAVHMGYTRLRPYHPERARSRLISEAKQGRAWLVLGWETWDTHRFLSVYMKND